MVVQCVIDFGEDITEKIVRAIHNVFIIGELGCREEVRATVII